MKMYKNKCVKFHQHKSTPTPQLAKRTRSEDLCSGSQPGPRDTAATLRRLNSFLIGGLHDT